MDFPLFELFLTNSKPLSGLPPGNDKIRRTLSTAEIFVPQKKFYFF